MGRAVYVRHSGLLLPSELDKIATVLKREPERGRVYPASASFAEGLSPWC